MFSLVLFIYSLFISIRVYTANMFKCRMWRYLRSQGTIYQVVIRLVVTGNWIVKMRYVKYDSGLATDPNNTIK